MATHIVHKDAPATSARNISVTMRSSTSGQPATVLYSAVTARYTPNTTGVSLPITVVNKSAGAYTEGGWVVATDETGVHDFSIPSAVLAVSGATEVKISFAATGCLTAVETVLLAGNAGSTAAVNPSGVADGVQSAMTAQGFTSTLATNTATTNTRVSGNVALDSTVAKDATVAKATAVSTIDGYFSSGKVTVGSIASDLTVANMTFTGALFMEPTFVDTQVQASASAGMAAIRFYATLGPIFDFNSQSSSYPVMDFVSNATTQGIFRLAKTGSGTMANAITRSSVTNLAPELDTTVGSRMATFVYTAPDNTNIGNIWNTVNTNLDAKISTRSTLDGSGVQSAMTAQGYTPTLATNLGTTNTTVATNLDGKISDISITLSQTDIDDIVDGVVAGIGEGVSVTVTVAPLQASVVTPTYTVNGGTVYPLRFAQNSTSTVTFAITDGTGAAVSLVGKTVSMVIHNQSASVWKITSPVISTNTATFTVGTPYTDNKTEGQYGYKIWNETDDVLLATGSYTVLFAPDGSDIPN